jgi:DNA-binding helix-hairpin-helix protein with protein kinase domain
MGKSMYNFGNRAKEKARQQKQIEKASQRIMDKQRKADVKTHTLNTSFDISGQGLVEEIVKKIS